MKKYEIALFECHCIPYLFARSAWIFEIKRNLHFLFVSVMYVQKIKSTKIA